MPETAQVTCFSQDGHCVDRADTGDGRQQLIVRQIGQELDGSGLNLIALPDQAAAFGGNEAEHAHCVGIRADRKPD